MIAETVWKPRNDWCLVRIVDLGEVRGIAMPDTAIQGKEFVIVAVGEEVDDLEAGNKVLMMGKQAVEFFPLPNSKDLIVIKQEHVVLVQEEK